MTGMWSSYNSTWLGLFGSVCEDSSSVYMCLCSLTLAVVLQYKNTFWNLNDAYFGIESRAHNHTEYIKSKSLCSVVVRYGVTADAQFNRLMVLLLQGTLYNHSPTPPYDDQFLLCEACGCHKAFLKLALDLTLYAECVVIYLWTLFLGDKMIMVVVSSRSNYKFARTR